MKKYGHSKGALSKAAEEAILNWISESKDIPEPFEGDPIRAMEGLLKDVKIDSVKLQHEATKIWSNRVLEKFSC